MRKMMTFVVMMFLALSALPAQADVWTFEDTVTHWDGWGTLQENNKDVIGMPDISGGEAVVSGNTLQSVSIFFTVDQYQNLYSSLSSGDLFVNTNNDSTWDYVVKLNSDLTVSVYEFNKSYTDHTAYQLAFYSGGDYRDNQPAWAKVFGEAIATGTWSGMPELDGSNSGTITIAGLNITFDSLTLGY
ncbi:MAG: hypothetical protein AB7E32_17685, partial [Desulfovibrio sp.]